MQRSSHPILVQAIDKISTSRLCEIAGILPSDLDSLLARIKEGLSDECWPWLGCKRNGGYGNWIGGYPRKNMYPHRIILAISLGRPLVHRALHKCDNRNCCNPNHLFEGTQSENIQDAVRKGRWEGRTGSGTATLSQVQADEIRSLLAEGSVSGAAIARRYNVSPSVIVAIRQGRTWTGVDRRYTNQAAKQVTDLDIQSMVKQTRTLAEAGSRLGLSATTICRRLKRIRQNS